MSSFSGVTFVLFCFVFVFMLSLKPRPFVQSFFDMHALRQPHAVTEKFSASFFVFISLKISLLPCIFVPLPFFSLYGEYVVRFSLPDGVFLPCDHGLDFFTSAYVVVVVFFTLTDRASTIPSNIRGCQPGTWSQRGTKVNGSHHGDNPLLRPTGIQIATKS